MVKVRDIESIELDSSKKGGLIVDQFGPDDKSRDLRIYKNADQKGQSDVKLG